MSLCASVSPGQILLSGHISEIAKFPKQTSSPICVPANSIENACSLPFCQYYLSIFNSGIWKPTKTIFRHLNLHYWWVELFIFSGNLYFFPIINMFWYFLHFLMMNFPYYWFVPMFCVWGSYFWPLLCAARILFWFHWRHTHTHTHTPVQ